MARKLDVGAMVTRDVFKLDTPSIQVVEIPLSQLNENEENFFRVEDVQALADDIALHGLDNPLTVCAAGDGKYRIVAGHRRRKALALLERQSAPCIVKSYDGEDSELAALISSNLTSRELTYYEKMVAVVRLEQALRHMKERGADLPGRLRDHLAEQAKESTSAVHRMTYIYKHLSPALLDALRREQIGESVADELAHSPKKVQTQFEQRLARGETFRAQDVKAAREKPAATDGEIDAFLLDHIAHGHEDALYRVLHDTQHLSSMQLVSEVKKALHFYGLHGHSSDRVTFELTGNGLEVKAPFRGKLTWAQIVQRLRIMVDSGKIAPPADALAVHERQLAALDKAMQAAVSEPAEKNDGLNSACKTGNSPSGHCGAAYYCSAPYSCCAACPDPCNSACGWLSDVSGQSVWHRYPDERPADGQKVLTLCHSKYNRDNYAAYIYRAGSWYLPEMPDDGLMTVDVRWWSAQLPPEEG